MKHETDWEAAYLKLAAEYRKEILANAAARPPVPDDMKLLQAMDVLRQKDITQELYITHLEELVQYFIDGDKSDFNT